MCPACDMPHGVKVNHARHRVYVSCMHSDEILEMDVATFSVTRRAARAAAMRWRWHGGRMPCGAGAGTGGLRAIGTVRALASG